MIKQKPFIRTAEPQDARSIVYIQVQATQAAYRNILPASLLPQQIDYAKIAAQRYRKIQQDVSKGVGIFVAQNEQSKIIGYVSGGLQRDHIVNGYDSELYNIFVLPECQRQGVGNALFRQMIEFLIKQEFRSMILWVIQETAATAYYQHLQGHKVTERQETIGGVGLKLDCYGWEDLFNLRKSLSC